MIDSFIRGQSPYHHHITINHHPSPTSYLRSINSLFRMGLLVGSSWASLFPLMRLTCTYFISSDAFMVPAPFSSRPPCSCFPDTAAAKKNFLDEILDGLDTMAGISPLGETDLKSGNEIDLQERALQRDQQAPPSDALQKPSVSIFFFLLGLIPCILAILAIQAGVRPFGL